MNADTENAVCTVENWFLVKFEAGGEPGEFVRADVIYDSRYRFQPRDWVSTSVITAKAGDFSRPADPEERSVTTRSGTTYNLTGPGQIVDASPAVAVFMREGGCTYRQALDMLERGFWPASVPKDGS